MVAGECWPAVKTPSTSLTLRPASRTALWMASTCRVSMLLSGSVPISSLSSTPTMQTVLLSSFIGEVHHRAPPARPPAGTSAG